MSFTRDCLKGKVALITGGGSGIGRGITSRFMELGAQTIIVSRKYDRVKSTAEELEKQTHAGTAKAGIDAMTKHLAAEWGPCGVRVNGVAPGPIAGTAGMSKLGTSKAPVPHGTSKKNDAGDDELDQLTAFIPLQRLGNQKDIANSVVFLCLPEASFITGHTLVVDGGTWLTAGNFAVLDTAVRKAWVERGKAIRAIANDTEFTSKL
uniref:2,4-dienoyl-CoA reductase [(3E)-enoyl-CoA-producing] n=1 Tax=Nephromyces sp. MMRI TaxID=2496275 RepID=A0A3Q8UBX2_9APIC|nr:2,4-dienoyl-CoA reductase 2 [Nephromyces sp. MMRI]AZL94564.1 2,4-dienoyl-CoA reductase 2 [Nephromyces sp. MMRI]AZL94565.1 2,4-dienoyl-CoA reductase 2 [Nephromyces sp. MMRI]AZL94567.1 2,4-dienoyl-CoA reductase 2 [Nephromyces sp. MMRI]